MGYQSAPTFDAHIAVMAIEAPSALVLDWWRKLDLELSLVATELGVPLKPRLRFEEELARDHRVSTEFAARVRALRIKRNHVAHGPFMVTGAEAKVFAREAFDLLGELARRPGRADPPVWTNVP